MKYLLIFICVLMLGACGKKGPLEPRLTSTIIDQR
jgi:predicted small lipoprotein YifL